MWKVDASYLKSLGGSTGEAIVVADVMTALPSATKVVSLETSAKKFQVIMSSKLYKFQSVIFQKQVKSIADWIAHISKGYVPELPLGSDGVVVQCFGHLQFFCRSTTAGKGEGKGKAVGEALVGKQAALALLKVIEANKDSSWEDLDVLAPYGFLLDAVDKARLQAVSKDVSSRNKRSGKRAKPGGAAAGEDEKAVKKGKKKAVETSEVEVAKTQNLFS